MLRITSSDDNFRQALADIFAAGPVGMLCGSALSTFYPTSLQGGRPTSAAVAEGLCRAAEVDPNVFKKVVEDAAYEAILQQYPDRTGDDLDKLFADYFLRYGEAGDGVSVPFNHIHAAVAQLLIDGRVRGVVTTNYDTCIEDAFVAARQQGDARLGNVIVAEDQLTETAYPTHPIFKLHGCARHQGTMVFRLDQEGQMPCWKRRAMANILGPRIVVVGYSGLDFEVCPELYDLGFDEIYWIEFSPRRGRSTLTAHALKVLKKGGRRSTVITADMRRVFAEWTQQPEPPSPATSSPRLLSDLLLNRLEASDKRLWAARTFNLLSVPAAAHAALAAESVACAPAGLSREFEDVRLGALNHSMRYYDNADANHRSAHDAAVPIDARIGHGIGESGSAWMAADYERSSAALEFARSLLLGLSDTKIRAARERGIDWMSLLLAKRKLDRSDRRQVRDLVARIRGLQERAFAAGEHLLRDLCEQEVAELTGGGWKPRTGSLSRSGAIFQQVGNYVGQVTARRTRLKQTRSAKLARGLAKDILLMEDYSLPAWRVYFALIDYEADPLARQRLYQQGEAALSACQFHPSFKQSVLAAARDAVVEPAGAKPPRRSARH